MRLIVRGDSAFAKPEICDWCEEQDDVHCLIGPATNSRLQALARTYLRRAGVEYLLKDVKKVRKPLKLGVLVRESCRKVWLQFASSCPAQHLWPVVLARMKA